MDQPGVIQNFQVKRQCIGGNRQLFGDLAGRHAFRAGLHEQPVHLQTAVLREGGESLDRGL